MNDWRDPRLGTARVVELPSGPIRCFESGTGPVLVFVHGYLVNANVWRKVVPLLSDSYRCLVPDWPLGAHVLPQRTDADLSPVGMADTIAGFLEALDLDDVVLVGNDSGGAYSQIAAARHPERLAGLVLNTCETPTCTWPPTPGGFPVMKLMARTRATHRLLYQPLRVPRIWRWRNVYGWVAKHPIEERVMRSYVGPVLRDARIREDGRRAIGSVDAEHIRRAATTLSREFDKPVLLAWAAEDPIFPLASARAYAEQLGAPLVTIADSYTYTGEDQPERTAEVLRTWLEAEVHHVQPDEPVRA